MTVLFDTLSRSALLKEIRLQFACFLQSHGFSNTGQNSNSDLLFSVLIQNAWIDINEKAASISTETKPSFQPNMIITSALMFSHGQIDIPRPPQTFLAWNPKSVNISQWTSERYSTTNYPSCLKRIIPVVWSSKRITFLFMQGNNWRTELPFGVRPRLWMATRGAPVSV